MGQDCIITAVSGPDTREEGKRVTEQKSVKRTKRKEGNGRWTSTKSWVTHAGGCLVGTHGAGTLGLPLTAYFVREKLIGNDGSFVVDDACFRSTRRIEDCGGRCLVASIVGQVACCGALLLRNPPFHT